MFHKILAATQNPTYCDEKVQTAAAIANKSGGKLYILHVLESSSSIYRNYVLHFKSGEEIVTNSAYEREVLEEIKKHCSAYLSADEIKIRAGFPWEEIVKYARGLNVDLIVLGPHEKQTKSSDFRRTTGKIGKTTEGVIHFAHSPIMIVNGPVSQRKMLFKRIMVAVDYSKSCSYALQWACRLAAASDSMLDIFTMRPRIPENAHTDAGADLAEQTEKLKVFCQDITGDRETQYHVVAGEQPHLEILKFARDNDMDLIAMGSHTKRKDNGGWDTGSVVENVSARSDCPVVVLTDPKAVAKFKA